MTRQRRLGRRGCDGLGLLEHGSYEVLIFAEAGLQRFKDSRYGGWQFT